MVLYAGFNIRVAITPANRHKVTSLLVYVFGADILKTAFITKWFCTGCADITSMVNQAMAEITSLFRWNDFPESHFYFFRFFDVVYQSHAVYKTDTMGICDNGRFSKDISHNEVCAFSSYSWKF